MSDQTNRNSTPRPDNEFWLGWLLKIANAVTVTLTDATIEVYLDRLTQLTFAEITLAAQRTIEEWEKPCMMPPLAFILERAHPTMINDSARVFGWESAGAKAGFSKHEIALLLEAGKATQREHIAKLEADPHWREMAARLGATPGLSAKAVRSEVPEDLAQRGSWARKKAIQQGWVSREPGDEA